MEMVICFTVASSYRFHICTSTYTKQYYVFIHVVYCYYCLYDDYDGGDSEYSHWFVSFCTSSSTRSFIHSFIHSFIQTSLLCKCDHWSSDLSSARLSCANAFTHIRAYIPHLSVYVCVIVTHRRIIAIANINKTIYSTKPVNQPTNHYYWSVRSVCQSVRFGLILSLSLSLSLSYLSISISFSQSAWFDLHSVTIEYINETISHTQPMREFGRDRQK